MARTKLLTDHSYSPTNPASELAIRTQMDDSIQEVYDDSTRPATTTAIADRVTVNEGDITTLDGRVTAAEGDITTLDSEVVKITGNQSIDGTKTYTSPVKGPIAVADEDYVRKDTVDGIVLGEIPDGSLTDVKLSNTAGQIKDTVSDNTTAIGTNTTDITTNETAIAEIAYMANTGTANAVVVAKEGFTLGNGSYIEWEQTASNTGAMTINVEGTGVKSLVKEDGTAYASGELEAGWYRAIYDLGNTRFFIKASSGGANPFDAWLNTFHSYENGSSMSATLVINVTGEGWLDSIFNFSSNAMQFSIEIDGVFVVESATRGAYVSQQYFASIRYETSLKVYVENTFNYAICYREGAEFEEATPVISTNFPASVTPTGIIASETGASGWIIATGLDRDSKLVVDGSTLFTFASAGVKDNIHLMIRYTDSFTFYSDDTGIFLTYNKD